jgi:serine/threonine kinase 16
MEVTSGCGSALGLPYLFRFLDAAAKRIMPAEQVVVGNTTFAVQSPLGEGGFSYVYLVREVPDVRGEDFALKRMLVPDAEDEDEDYDTEFEFGKTAVEREIAVMKLLNHPNVLTLINADVEPADTSVGNSTRRRRANLVFPVFSEGTMLDRCLNKPQGKAFTTKQLLRVGAQVTSALTYMHSLKTPIAHRDVKPGNVLLETCMETSGGTKAVLMDFGSARPANVTVENRAMALVVQERAARECTASFRAPELFDTPSKTKIDARVDVWSLGCLLFALVNAGRSPFEDSVHETGGSLALVSISHLPHSDD